MFRALTITRRHRRARRLGGTRVRRAVVLAARGVGGRGQQDDASPTARES